MADLNLAQGQQLPQTAKSRYVDLGSGVYALLVATADSGLIPDAAELTLVHTAVNVNGSTAVLAANANRRYLLIVNDSDTVVYLWLRASAAAANRGIRLNASGGSFEMTPQSGMYTGAILANHGGGAVNKLLLITEGV
jgi:hypothetical protein